MSPSTKLGIHGFGDCSCVLWAPLKKNCHADPQKTRFRPPRIRSNTYKTSKCRHMLRASVFDQNIWFNLKPFDPNSLFYDREHIRYTRIRHMHITHDFQHVGLEATAGTTSWILCPRSISFSSWAWQGRPKGQCSCPCTHGSRPVPPQNALW